MNRNQVAASVAKQKEAHPENFCPATRCLWNTKRQQANGGSQYCPRHPPPDFADLEARRSFIKSLTDSLEGLAK